MMLATQSLRRNALTGTYQPLPNLRFKHPLREEEMFSSHLEDSKLKMES